MYCIQCVSHHVPPGAARPQARTGRAGTPGARPVALASPAKGTGCRPAETLPPLEGSFSLATSASCSLLPDKKYQVLKVCPIKNIISFTIVNIGSVFLQL